MRAAGPGSAEIALRRYVFAPRQVEEVSQVPPGLVRTAIGHDGEPTDAAETAFSRIETAAGMARGVHGSLATVRYRTFGRLFLSETEA